MRRLLELCLLLLLVGCQGVDKTPETPDLAVINLWSGPYYPSLLFKVRDNGNVVLHRNLNGKDSTYLFVLSDASKSALLTAARNAKNEIAGAPQKEGFADGWNIKIVLDGDSAGAVQLKNYPQGRSDWQFIPVLFAELRKAVPNKYW